MSWTAPHQNQRHVVKDSAESNSIRSRASLLQCPLSQTAVSQQIGKYCFLFCFLFCLREYLRVTDKHVYCRLFVKIVSAALRNTITFGAVFLIFIENLEHFLDAVPESGNLGNRISWSKAFYQQYIFTKCFLELCKLPLLAGHIQLNVHTVQYICTRYIYF